MLKTTKNSEDTTNKPLDYGEAEPLEITTRLTKMKHLCHKSHNIISPELICLLQKQESVTNNTLHD